MSTLRRVQPPPRPWRNPRVQQGNLETLFVQEREFTYDAIPPVVLLNSGRPTSSSSLEKEIKKEKFGIVKDKWRFQDEILRAKCKSLRMERKIAARRSNRERLFMDTTLKSSLHSLTSARRRVGEGQNASSVMKEEIAKLAMKLADIPNPKRRDPELLKDCDIDVGHEVIGLSRGSYQLADVDILTKKMETLSEGKLFKKMEDEYGSMLTTTVDSSATTSQRYDQLDLSSLLQLQVSGRKKCAGQCKVIVRRIMEQVRAETEQWSEMQEMVGQVRHEMEHLQTSRDYWEARALRSHSQIQSLNATVKEWKQKALSLELENQLQPPEKEKRIITCRVVQGKNQQGHSCRKERESKVIHKGGRIHASPCRQPFRDIGNCT